MRKLIFFMHVSLDGFVAGPNGEMNWIKIDESMFDFVSTMTDQSDTALYGRVTYELMDGYWPTAGEKPGASKHDIEHSTWYNKVAKIVLSRTMDGKGLTNITVLADDISEKIKKIKKGKGKNILIFGSPRASQSLLNLKLIDEFWLFVNPVILGQGLPMFNNIAENIELKLIETRIFSCGVVALHYSKL